MKKLSIVTALTLGLSLPLSAMADDDVTIRVMEMNEVSSDAVMQQIELPDAASDEAAENGEPGLRERERIREHAGDGEELMQQEGEMEQYREMEQMHEGMMEDQYDTPETQDVNGDQTGMHGVR